MNTTQLTNVKSKKLTRYEILTRLVKEIETLKPVEGKHYEIEYAAIYGGYRLVLVDNKSGGHYGCFGGNGCESRMKFSAMIDKLHTIIYTLQN